MIQTADGVLTSMDHRNDSSIPPKIRENIVDAGKTIILCAQHQKRIGKRSNTFLLSESGLYLHIT
jgi:hypothetical protein